MATIEAAQAAADTGLFLGFRLIVLVLGLVRLKDGNMTVGSLMTLLALQSMTSGPISRLYSIASSVQTHLRFSQTLFEIIAADPDPLTPIPKPSPTSALTLNSKPSSLSLQPLKSQIQIQNISFTYSHGEGSQTTALRDVTFSIPMGTFVALIGANGSGKSTLLHLIHKLYSPTTAPFFCPETRRPQYPKTVDPDANTLGNTKTLRP